jgi:hypothetical protein
MNVKGIGEELLEAQADGHGQRGQGPKKPGTGGRHARRVAGDTPSGAGRAPYECSHTLPIAPVARAASPWWRSSLACPRHDRGLGRHTVHPDAVDEIGRRLRRASGQLAEARVSAVARSACRLAIQPSGSDYRYSAYTDGNGNGVRR